MKETVLAVKKNTILILENKSDLHNTFAMNDVHESSFIHHSRFKSKWNHGVCIITVLKY